MIHTQSSFQIYAKQKGIQLLKDDIVFIKACLAKMPYNERRGALETYANIWLHSMVKCEIAYCRQNKGRFSANTWLREQALPKYSE